MAFNFGQIAPILSNIFDRDKIEISRTESVQIDGRWRDQVTTIKDVLCHLVFDRTDNPNPTTSDLQPINITITIVCPISVDLQNGDLITAHKLAHDGSILETYTGIIGMPQVVQSRKRAILIMQEG